MSADRRKAPRVSIIVPSYNQGRFIAETLDSILAQDYRPLEIAVIDGASTDETRDILSDYGGRYDEIRWWSEPDDGLPDAVNKGLERATGVYAGIQSSDDIYRPGAISEAVSVLQSDPGLGLVYGDIEIIDEEGRVLGLASNRRPFTKARFLARTTLIHQSSAFFDLELARAVGGWNPAYFCADTEMWLRMVFRTRVLHVDRVWSAWRKHGAQRDRERVAMWEDWGRMVAESPDIARAPLNVRLAARAGRRLMALDYNPTTAHRFRVVQAWRAVLTYPPSFAGVHPKRTLFPGVRDTAAHVAKTVRRRFGRRPS